MNELVIGDSPHTRELSTSPFLCTRQLNMAEIVMLQENILV